MNVQDFTMQLTKSGGGKTAFFPELGKNHQEDGQFQSLLENMGLLAMLQNPMTPQMAPQLELDGKTADLAVSMAEIAVHGSAMPEYTEIPKGMETLFLGKRISTADIRAGEPALEVLQKADMEPEPDLVITAEFALPAAEDGQEPLTGRAAEQNQPTGVSAPSKESVMVPDGIGQSDEAFREAMTPQRTEAPQSAEVSQRAEAPAADEDTPTPVETIPSLAQDDDGQAATVQLTTREPVEHFQIRQPRKAAVPSGQEEAEPMAEAQGQINIQSFSGRSKTQETIPHVTVRQEADFPDAIGKALNTAVRTGKDEFEIRLEPENLGRISIKISASENQTVITLSCSQEKTLHLLTQNAREIGAIMETNLGTAPQILVEKQAADYLEQEKRQEGRQPKEERQQQQQKHRDDDPEDFLQRLRVGMMTVVPQ